MRGIIITFAVLGALAFVYHSQAAAIEEKPAPAEPEKPKDAAKLLNVEAGSEHGNEASRNTRHYGWAYGWGHPWSYYSNSWGGRPWGGYGWGAWGGYGGGYGGGWGGRPWNYWG